MLWTVYILRCGDDSLYTGIARDVARRIAAHNAGRGAAYTRSRRPVVLLYQEAARDRSAALRREYAIKQLTRVDKEGLIMTRRPLSKSAPGAPAGRAGFRPGAIRFLRQLARQNTKPWFEAHRAELRGGASGADAGR